MSDGPLHLSIKRWPDQEARFQLSRPMRKPHPLSMGLSLAEMIELGELAREAAAIVAESPHSEGYSVGDVKQIAEARKVRAA